MQQASSLVTLEPQPDRAALGAAALTALLDGVPAGLLSFDAQLGIRFANRALATLLAIPDRDFAQAATLRQLLAASRVLPPGGAPFVHEACRAAIAGAPDGAPAGAPAGTPDGTMTLPGGPRAFTLRITALPDATWLAAFEETTDHHAAAATALEAAMSDALTGLPGRRQFERRVTEVLAGATVAAGAWRDPAALPPAMLLIDLDRFKAVNDTLGHLIGDNLLSLVGKRLRSLLRQEDLVARLGGDEFGLLVGLVPEAGGLETLGRRIVDLLGRPYLIGGHLVNIGASVGIAAAPDDGETYDDLLRSADLAMYAAKSAGRSTYRFFTAAMGDQAVRRRALEIDLRKAMVLGQFELHYQPQIDIKTNTIEGFEALVRWRHPERGLVSPSQFIPLAEEIGLIVPLGEWVIRRACEEALGWPDSIGIAVNVSPHQFEHPERLVEVIMRSLAQSGLPGARLEIEITEGVLLRNDVAVIEALHRVRAMGVRVAMDDFGTGYSSLSQLHSFPFDKIKIDQSFVSGQSDIAGQNAIIRAITALGSSLGMVTIAEGVETSEQLARIRNEGCSSVQGYLFSRPVPIDQVHRLIADFTGAAPQPCSTDGSRPS